MSLDESIDALITDTLVVTRHAVGTYTAGIYATGAVTTFTCDAAVQPAFGLNRVVGGADLGAKVDGQHVTDVRDFFTRTFLKTRTPTTDPDVITGFEGADWTVARVEKWNLSGEVYYRCLISKITGGAS